MEDFADKSGLIAEYKELRAEIRLYLETRTKIKQIVFVFVAALIGFYGKLDSPNSPYIYGAAFFILIFIWHDQLRQLRAVKRIATYIQVFIEANIDGIGWEERSSYHPFGMKKHPIIGALDRTFLKDPFLVFIALSELAILDKAHWLDNSCIILVAILIFLGVFILFMMLTGYYLNHDKHINKWIKTEKGRVENN